MEESLEGATTAHCLSGLKHRRQNSQILDFEVEAVRLLAEWLITKRAHKGGTKACTGVQNGRPGTVHRSNIPRTFVSS